MNIVLVYSFASLPFLLIRQFYTMSKSFSIIPEADEIAISFFASIFCILSTFLSRNWNYSLLSPYKMLDELIYQTHVPIFVDKSFISKNEKIIIVDVERWLPVQIVSIYKLINPSLLTCIVQSHQWLKRNFHHRKYMHILADEWQIALLSWISFWSFITYASYC